MVDPESSDAGNDRLRYNVRAVIGTPDAYFEDCSIDLHVEESMESEESQESEVARFLWRRLCYSLIEDKRIAWINGRH